VSPHIRASLTRDEEADLIRSRRKQEGAAKDAPVAMDPQLRRAADALRGTLIFAKKH
jgi:hypothetical protein